MSNPQERQAGTSGSTMGYEQGQARGQGYETERAAGRGPAPTGHRAEPHRGAVAAFSGVGATLLILGGFWNVIVGLAAVSRNHVFVTAPGSNYYYSWSLNGWGWLTFSVGCVLFAVGVCIFLGIPFARYVGAGVAVLSGIANFMLIPYSPIWAIILVAIDAFIIWALLSPRQTAGEF